MSNHPPSFTNNIFTKLASNKWIVLLGKIAGALVFLEGLLAFIERVSGWQILQIPNFLNMSEIIPIVIEIAQLLLPLFMVILLFAFPPLKKKLDEIYYYLFTNDENNLRDYIKKTIRAHYNHDADIFFLSAEMYRNKNTSLSDSLRDEIQRRANTCSSILCILRAIDIERSNPETRNLKVFLDTLGFILIDTKQEDLQEIKEVNKIDIQEIITNVENSPLAKSVMSEILGLRKRVLEILKQN